MWLTPSPEELRAKYNPDLRKRSLEQGHEREQEFDDFVNRLKEYSKSDKSSEYLHRTITLGTLTMWQSGLR